MDWDPKISKDPVKKTAWLASSKNTFGFKDEAKQTVSSSLQNTLSNYFFEVESPDDQVYSKQTRNIKQSKKAKGKTKVVSRE
jgi:hypothetical protein